MSELEPTYNKASRGGRVIRRDRVWNSLVDEVLEDMMAEQAPPEEVGSLPVPDQQVEEPQPNDEV